MEMEHHDVNLHASDGDGDESEVGVDAVTNPSEQGGMEEKHGGETQIWSLQTHHDDDDLLEVNEPSMFYDDFPPLPEFPCMSSSSSSSSTPAPAKPISSSSSSASSSSSSSAASWAVLKADAEQGVSKSNQHSQRNNPCDGAAALSSTASMELVTPSEDGVGDMDCIDVMEDFGYMDLIDGDEIWDQSSIFQSENARQRSAEEEQELMREQERELLRQEQAQAQGQGQAQAQVQAQAQAQAQAQEQCYMLNENMKGGMVEQGRPLNELGIMFFEWLKSNKEYISAEDMRSIKLRRATVESASKRLGSTREGRKQLLKLILEWVEQYQLQKKRMREEAVASQLTYQYQEPFHNTNPNPNYLNCASLPPDPTNTCFSPSNSLWMPTQRPYVADPTIIAAASVFAPASVGFMADTYSNGGASASPLTQQMNAHTYTAPAEYHMLDSAQVWSASQIGLASQYNNPFQDVVNLGQAQQHPQALGYANAYPYQCYHGNGEKLVGNLCSSATREARKKRMARHRRFFSQHRHNHHQNQQNQQQNQTADQHARLGGDKCTNTVQASLGNWVYWTSTASPSASTAAMVPPTDRLLPQGQNYQRQVSSDRRQVWKHEKNLKFLLQKVLKQSDVGNLGRIVLPKKEAETHLPELEARDGITISMEDIGTSHVWSMRYRFWPNNKSRMYLLENTGDFVRANGLQEGDFIVIYSDVKCGKYLIRGVKVRQPAAPKLEAKRSAKSQKTLHTTSPAVGNDPAPTQPLQKQ